MRPARNLTPRPDNTGQEWKIKLCAHKHIAHSLSYKHGK